MDKRPNPRETKPECCIDAQSPNISNNRGKCVLLLAPPWRCRKCRLTELGLQKRAQIEVSVFYDPFEVSGT